MSNTVEVNLIDLYKKIDALYASPGNMPVYKKGRSIVTSVYGKELASGYVLMRELIRLGVTLPIEVFYREGELTIRDIDILRSPKPQQISVKSIKGNPKDFVTPYGTSAGWSTKIYAIYESDYEENLWLDSDNFPIRNPEFLFDDFEYQKKHSLFWRDVFSTDRSNRYHDGAVIWPVFDVAPNDAEPFETGQILLNKPNVWDQIRLVKHYADNCEIYYHFGGDAETFRLAWQYHNKRFGYYHSNINYHASNDVPYGFMPYGPFHKGIPNQYHKWGGGTVMVQRDREGRELFNHRNMHKMSVQANTFNQDITNEMVYHQHIDDLRKLIGLA